MKRNEELLDKVAYLENADCMSVMGAVAFEYYADEPVWSNQKELELIEKLIARILKSVENQKKFPVFDGKFTLDRDTVMIEHEGKTYRAVEQK